MKELVRPNLETCNDKAFSKWYWSKHNDKCSECTHSCKQSHVALLVNCNKFTKLT